MEPKDAFEHYTDKVWPLPPGIERLGAGCFGRWAEDGQGQPVYVYEMAQNRDPRAAYRVTAGTSRDHWHLLGNDRITATAHNGGYVRVFDWSRGGRLLNPWKPEHQDYAGGFKWVVKEGETLCTLWEQLPASATQQRIFGMGYFEKTTRWNGLIITERIEAPPGDDPLLLSTTTIENAGTAPFEVSVTEFWQHAHEFFLPIPVAMPPLDRPFRWRRESWRNRFEDRPSWHAEHGFLMVESILTRSGRSIDLKKRSLRDYCPKPVFLAALDRLPENFSEYCADKQRFFGAGGLERPDGLGGAVTHSPAVHPRTMKMAAGRAGAPDCCSMNHWFIQDIVASSWQSGAPALPAVWDNTVLAIRQTTVLGVGEKRTWRYAYGYATHEDAIQLIRKYASSGSPAGRPVVGLVAPDAPELQRELAWHAYYLQAHSSYNDYCESHIVDQGSAYGYIHGLSGATRDFALFTLPMVYLRPDLAKDMLRFCARLQHHRTGALPYALVGHGCARGYLVHSKSTDLDLFFLWAASEYLAATQDRAFLDEPLHYYPRERGVSGTFLDHCRTAFRHLVERVGLGPHGLLRCGTGDWNDVLFGYSRFSPLTLWRGESALNAGLAAMVLPWMADAIEAADGALAESMRGFVRQQANALEPLWMGDWLARGYLGYGGSMLGQDRLFLDTQSFPVLAGLWDSERTARLFSTIQSQCAGPQQVGARCLWPPMRGPFLEPGSDTNGGTWAAIDSWLAWAWSLHDPKAAWDFYRSTTLAARAEAYPDVWYGVWSGPDSYNAHYHSRPGETFQLNATPMTDFPVMNMNRHSGPLLAGLKMAGFAPRGDTLVIDPHLPFDTFAVRTPLMGVAYRPGDVCGHYRPVTDGVFHFRVRRPAQSQNTSPVLRVDGVTASLGADSEGFLCFQVCGIKGEEIQWEIPKRGNAMGSASPHPSRG